jgi:hypothetical protein
MELRKATRRQSKIRLGLTGPSGSGKTYSALQIAFGLCGDWGKIAIIDTENGSADLYSHLGAYNVLPLEKPFTPERYTEAIQACELAGIEVAIIDSASHEWEGSGGALEIKDSMGGKYQDWARVTPRHQSFVDSILGSKCHVIVCVRSKNDYAMITENNRVKVEKVGMKHVQREGLDYEMTIDIDLEISHNAVCTKDRTGLFMGKPVFIPSVATGKLIKDWCDSGASPIVDRKMIGKLVMDKANGFTKDEQSDAQRFCDTHGGDNEAMTKELELLTAKAAENRASTASQPKAS